MIIEGIYLSQDPDQLIVLAEMFDYIKSINQITIGYRIYEAYWHRGIATDTVKLMINYLCNDICMQNLKALVMPENAFSEKVQARNGFAKMSETVHEKNCGGQDNIDLNVFIYTVQ